jgi:6,7-dimethyl-8-ribityllumazine synthase
MSEHHWPGEKRLVGTEQQEPDPEASAEAEPVEPEAEAEAAPQQEQITAEPEEPKPAVGEETPEPDEAPAEEDELQRLRPPGEHADGELSVPEGYAVLTGSSDGNRRAVGVVVSRFNGDVTNRLLQSALEELERAGVVREAVTVVQVPGAFELPLGAMALAKTRRFACIIALGCVIRGDTPHFDYVAGEAASGLQLAALETGIPISFGVLTLESAEQADERIDKGAEAVRGALEMADVFTQLRANAAG